MVFMLFAAMFLTSCNKADSGAYPVIYAGKKLGYTFIDKKGEPLFEEVYKDILKNFEDGYAIVRVEDEVRIIDAKGRDALDKGFSFVYEVKDGLAMVKEGEKSTCYDLKSKEALFSYDFIKMPTNGIFAFMDGGSWGYRTKDEIIVDPSFDEAFPFGKNNAISTRNGVVYKVDKKGNETATDYSEVTRIELSDYLIALNGDNDLLNLDGELLIRAIPGDIVELKGDKLAVVYRKDGFLKTGVINTAGKEIIPPIYDDIRLLSKDYFANNKDGKFALFNMKNEKLTEYEYDYLNADYFENNGGIISGLKGDEAVFLDKNGATIPSPNISGAIDAYKDRDLFVIAAKEGLYYFDNDTLVSFSASPTPLENLLQVHTKEHTKDYVKIYGNNLPDITNDVLMKLIDTRSGMSKRDIKYELKGDILYVTVDDGDKYELMVNLRTPSLVNLDDIFKEENKGEMELRIKEWAGIDNKAVLVGFTLDDELVCYFVDKKKPEYKIERFSFPYEKIEEFIKIEDNEFFKAKQNPIINVEA